MSVAQTALVFVLIPLAIYGITALLTMRSKFGRTPRYRPGDDWEFEPVWWSANPRGLDLAGHALGASSGDNSAAQPAATARGGARGNW